MVDGAWAFDCAHDWVEERSWGAPVDESRGLDFATTGGLAQ
jgi:hypothetical protein